MARLRVSKVSETAKEVILNLTLESAEGERFGRREVVLPKTATATEVQAAILQARADINADPKGGVEDIAKNIVDRINSGDLP